MAEGIIIEFAGRVLLCNTPIALRHYCPAKNSFLFTSSRALTAFYLHPQSHSQF